MTQELLDGFVDEEPPPAPIIDRSTLERYGTCPHQGWWVERGGVSTGNEATDVGDEVHRILSAAVKARHVDHARPAELHELIKELAAKSRPDVQPQVIEAVKRTYPIVSLLCYHGEGERAPEDILRYDGGEGDRSGQLAAELVVTGGVDNGYDNNLVTLTAEMDLLVAGASPRELDLYDWKSGWRPWTATEVRDSFQFQFYPWLVMRNYPDVERVNVSIILSRFGDSTSPVEFTRWSMYAAEQRMRSAARLYLKYHAAGGPDDVPTLPAPAKCSTCEAAYKCLSANLQTRELAVDPEGYLRDYAATVARAEQMEAALVTAVRVNGKDFVYPDVAFGMEAPKQQRAPACKLYGGRK